MTMAIIKVYKDEKVFTCRFFDQ